MNFTNFENFAIPQLVRMNFASPQLVRMTVVILHLVHVHFCEICNPSARIFECC